MSIHFEQIKSDQLLLRRFTADDLDNVFKGLSDPIVNKYYGVSYSSLNDTVTQMDWFNHQSENGLGIWTAVCSPDGATFYGAVGLNDLKAMHKKAEIGFWLLPSHWGKGIMAEAAGLICEYGFTALNLNRIEAFVETHNQSSQNLLARLGFLYEGTMQNCEIKNGSFISLSIYAKFKS